MGRTSRCQLADECNGSICLFHSILSLVLLPRCSVSGRNQKAFSTLRGLDFIDGVLRIARKTFEERVQIVRRLNFDSAWVASRASGAKVAVSTRCSSDQCVGPLCTTGHILTRAFSYSLHSSRALGRYDRCAQADIVSLCLPQ